MKKILYIVRGLPGSGKTTLAHSIAQRVYSADDYFTDARGNYNFDASKLGVAHAQCMEGVKYALANWSPGFDRIAVANTFTTHKELAPYLELKSDEVDVFVMTVENYHGNQSVHNVPQEKMEQMERRYSLKLR